MEAVWQAKRPLHRQERHPLRGGFRIERGRLQRVYSRRARRPRKDRRGHGVSARPARQPHPVESAALHERCGMRRGRQGRCDLHCAGDAARSRSLYEKVAAHAISAHPRSRLYRGRVRRRLFHVPAPREAAREAVRRRSRGHPRGTGAPQGRGGSGKMDAGRHAGAGQTKESRVTMTHSLPQTHSLSSVQNIAERLDTAWRTKAPIPPITESDGITDVKIAYEIQTHWSHLRLGRGEKIIGRKIGLTSQAIQQQLGVSEPDYGALWLSSYYEAQNGRVM